MASSLGFKLKYVLGIADKLLAELDKVAAEMLAVAAVGTETTMVERLSQHIAHNTKSLQKRWFKKQL